MFLYKPEEFSLAVERLTKRLTRTLFLRENKVTVKGGKTKTDNRRPRISSKLLKKTLVSF